MQMMKPMIMRMIWAVPCQVNQCWYCQWEFMNGITHQPQTLPWAIVALQVEQASDFPVVHKLVIHICINGCMYCRSASLCCWRSCTSFQNMRSSSDKARHKSSRHWKRGTGKLTKIFRDNSSPLAHWEVPAVCSLLPAQHQEVLDAA